MIQITMRAENGKHRSFLETRNYAQGVKAAIPVLTVQGSHAGPLAVMMAGQHGSELNGIASIERVFRQLNPRALKGKVVFLPVMNPISIRSHGAHYPIIGTSNNMNRVWMDCNTSPDRSYAREIAAAVWNTYLKHADAGLDLHCCNSRYLPHAYASKRNRALLHAFGIPCCRLTDKPSVPSCPGMALAMATTHGVPTVIGELPAHHTIDIESVRMGERGILNILKFMGMLEGDLDLPEYQYEFEENHAEMVIKTPVEGLLVSDCVQGQMVKEGQTVVRVLSLETLATTWEFKTPQEAMLLMIGFRWKEHMPESFVVCPGQTAAILKKPSRIIHNRRLK